jgi:polyisoprenoid-binding protein YceI
MHMIRGGLAIAAVLAIPFAASAQADVWTIDPGHSAAQFTVRHMLVANVRGGFDGPTGTVTFDPARLADTLRVQATFDARTINTRNEDRDRDLRSPNFFDVARFPTLTFRSTGVKVTEAGHVSLTGDLTMHGVTRQVTLDVEGPTPAVKDLDGRTRIGASATTTIDRRDFGLRYNELLETGGAVVGNEVRITIDIEMTRN